MHRRCRQTGSGSGFVQWPRWVTAECLRTVCEVARKCAVVSAVGLTVRGVGDVALQLKALLFPAIADIAVRSVDVDVENVRLDAQCPTAGAACPGCGVCSSRVHSSYLRFLADVPSAGRSVVLQLRVRQFRCGNTKCPRRTFVEQTSGLTRRHGQRTERLRSILTAVGLALAGRAGARLAAVLGMSISRSAVLFAWSGRCASRRYRCLGWWVPMSTPPARAAATALS